jgi:hypothetical protein
MPAAGCEPRPAQSDSPRVLDDAQPYNAEIHAQFRESNRYRTPGWCWDWATHLLETGRRPHPVWDGPFVEAAVKYQRLVRDYSEVDLAEQMPELHCARRIFTTTRMLRWELESRILAREPFEAVAEKTCQTVEVVKAYEATFFNVLDRLHVPYYIVHEVIRAPHTFDPQDPGVVWRFFAYHAGTAVLDALIAHFLALPGPDYTCLLDGSLSGREKGGVELSGISLPRHA